MNQKPNRLPLKLFVPVLLLCAATFTGCQKDVKNELKGSETNLTIRFTPVVRYDSVRMYFDTTTYINRWNESFIVKNFKFYIRAIRVTNTTTNQGFEIDVTKYYLVDFRDSASALVKIGVLPGTYNRLSFILGVDSTHNVSGAQTDALDPTHGMFWTWTTGYIFAKLEGTSPSSTAAGNMFMYHVGGFKQGEDANKEIQLFFPYNTGVTVSNGKNTVIDVTADVYDWFGTPHDIKIAQKPTLMTPGAMALQLADNYSKMFTVMGVKIE